MFYITNAIGLSENISLNKNKSKIKQTENAINAN